MTAWRSIPFSASAPDVRRDNRRSRARLAAQPAGFDIFHQQRTGAVFGIRQAFIQHLHHRQAGIEADEIGQLQRPHRMIGAQPHGGVDRVDIADAFIERIDRLVDHRQQDAVDDEGGKSSA